MKYESPTLHHRGFLREILLGLVSGQTRAKHPIDRRIKKLLASVDAHLGNIDWNVTDACQELRLEVSPAHAARLFKRHTGQGLREYAKKRRLALAAERLAITDLPIKTIAAEFGYRQPVDFTRRFKLEFGITPAQFRQQST